ncbi:MAG: nuclear transport factor 2 family protein [Microscillaceae bacterium]|nr:nuclear transport factor 2 family protein [Microscillaceae bacterium]
MKNFLVMALLFFCFAQVNAQKKSSENVIQDLEKRRFMAQVEKDTVFLQQILADDLVYIHSSSILENKKEYIANISKRRWDYRKIEVEKNQVRVYQNTAIVTGTAQMSLFMQEKINTFRANYTAVYCKIKGKWQMVSWQNTRIPE